MFKKSTLTVLGLVIIALMMVPVTQVFADPMPIIQCMDDEIKHYRAHTGTNPPPDVEAQIIDDCHRKHKDNPDSTYYPGGAADLARQHQQQEEARRFEEIHQEYMRQRHLQMTLDRIDRQTQPVPIIEKSFNAYPLPH